MLLPGLPDLQLNTLELQRSVSLDKQTLDILKCAGILLRWRLSCLCKNHCVAKVLWCWGAPVQWCFMFEESWGNVCRQGNSHEWEILCHPRYDYPSHEYATDCNQLELVAAEQILVLFITVVHAQFQHPLTRKQVRCLK